MNNTMLTLHGVFDDLVEFSMLPAVLNMDSTSTLPGLTARSIVAISERIG